jgi:MtrB/PioB family decaheme-associated outer membrane protein
MCLGARDMKRRFALGSLAGPVILATAMISSSAMAQTVGSPPSVADTYWAYHGDVEAGGRAFINNPQKDGVASQGQKSLGKYYEYSTIKPGPFVDGWLNAGSKDGLYRFDVWADNVGYTDQRFEAGGSKAGEYYFTGGWDQTPHIYSTNAQTLYNGVGTNALTLPAGLSNTLFTDAGCARSPNRPPTGCTTAGSLGTASGSGVIPSSQGLAVQRDITRNLHTTDIGIRRDTGSAAFRWTPTDAWDINFDYSHLHRTGTQVDGVVFSPGTSGVSAQVPKPIDDTTQNFGINGEYKGTSPWGKLLTFKVGYGGSLYQDAFDSYTVDNPFCATGSGPGECARGGTNPAPASNASPSSPSALMGLPPNNQAHGFNSTIGLDLPVQSRYVGNYAYTMMRQNQAFLPFTNQALVYNGPIPIAPATNPNAYSTQGVPGAPPASSLNGAINTFLANNVVTTQITPDLKSKLSYRYYDYANDTPAILLNDWVVTDVKLASSTTATYAPVRSLSVSYNKQNAGGDLVWSPTRQWNLGAGFGYERYKWTQEAADVTHENSGKVFADWKPASWLTTRASWVLSDRHYDTYDYRNLMGNVQWTNPTCITAGCSTQNSIAMRQFYLDNRARNVGKFSVSIDVVRGLTFTPTFGYQEDNYSISSTELGLVRSQSIKSGAELAYAFSPGTTILLSYMNEQYRQNLKYSTATGLAAVTAATTWHTDVRDNVNTLMAAANWTAIPDKLDFRASYTISLSTDSQPINADNGATPAPATGGQTPDVKGQWSRFEVLAKYTFDKERVRAMGINGEAYAKLRYVWERNSVNNFDQDIMQAYMNSLVGSTGFATWMAYDNPNYNVHLVGASLGLKW